MSDIEQIAKKIKVFLYTNGPSAVSAIVKNVPQARSAYRVLKVIRFLIDANQATEGDMTNTGKRGRPAQTYTLTRGGKVSAGRLARAA